MTLSSHLVERPELVFFPLVARICPYFPGYSPGDDLIAEFVAAVKSAPRDCARG